jgi:hypothetical protein
LAAKANGTKLKPFIIFNKGYREAEHLNQQTQGAVIVANGNGWMNDQFTGKWIDAVMGGFAFQKRLLVWDEFRAHTSATTVSHLRQL